MRHKNLILLTMVSQNFVTEGIPFNPVQSTATELLWLGRGFKN